VEYQPPERRTVDESEVAQIAGSLIDEVARGRVRLVVQRDGKDIAALVSSYDLERLEMLDRRAAEGWKTIQEIWARNADVDPEEAERDIAEAIAEVRAEARAKAKAKASATPTT
jgi:hypothetical protein